jgi:hypothetical protein
MYLSRNIPANAGVRRAANLYFMNLRPFSFQTHEPES